MFRKLMRQACVLMALGAMVAGDLRAEPFRAAPGGRGGDSEVCAAERAPIQERQRQYQALKRSRVAKAAGEGLKKGATFFAGAMLNKYAGGGGSSSGGGFGGFGGLPFGGIPFGGGKSSKTAAAPAPAPSGPGAFLNAGILSEAAGYSIPGVTMGPGGRMGGGGLGGDTKAIAAVAVIVAIAGTVEAYVRLKEAEANGDRARMVRSIEDDAGRQIPVSRAIALEEAALAACLQRQITDADQHLASASNTSDRRSQRASLIKAIRRDVDLTTDVCDQQATLAKTYTQGRAMTEGRSEADVLGGQAPAYADKASGERLRMPDSGDAKVQKVSAKAAPAPPPPPTYAASRATVIRAAPNAKARALANVAAGTAVQVTAYTGDTWATVETSTGAVGYVLADHLSVSDGSVQPAAAGGGRLAAPTNVREHNRAVIQAREQGPNRLKSLLTNIEAA